MRIKFFILPFLLIFLCSAGPLQLSKRDIRRTTDVMLNYHVEYKEFSPLLARRSLKIYIEQFDPDRVYLLADEALPFLAPRDKHLKSIVSNYQKDDFSEYEALNRVIQSAIARAREMREECAEELVASEEEVKAFSFETYSDFAKNETELRDRTQRYLTYILAKEKQMSNVHTWDVEYKKMTFDLWERRFHRMEDAYLFTDSHGKALSADLSEHLLSMHILKSLAKSLDAHTSYYTPEEAYEMRASLEKQFEGIGVVLREAVDGIAIVGLIKGGPAERSGRIEVGDFITSIDGKSIAGLSYEEVLHALQGTGNSHVQLGLKRLNVKEDKYFKVSLNREKIVMEDDRLQYAAEPFADGIIGKLILPSFYESTDGSSCEKDIREALRALKKKGKLLGVVLDLRENSGGFLNQAVKVASLFLSSGVVVISKYAKGETHYLRNLDIRSYYNGPLIVLTSRASASAAEIVAQALQDYGTALVVGDERTYGKGTIQYQTVTDANAPCFFKVTVGRYYTVSGRSTQIEGVLADIFVPTAYSAINIGERYLEFPLKSDHVASAYVDPLVDIDQRNRMWFQQNYLPNLQKKLSIWTQMASRLKKNTAHRLSVNKDYKLFLKTHENIKTARSFKPTSSENWGLEDLQMIEGVRILKDMICLKGKDEK